MTLRDAIDAVLGGLDLGTDPATVLAEHGLGDLPVDAFSSALVHFAERAPLDLADSLAPIVSRLSPVPFELDDLHPSEADAILDSGGDAFSLLSEVGLADVGHHGDADPSGFDHGHGDEHGDDFATGHDGDGAEGDHLGDTGHGDVDHGFDGEPDPDHQAPEDGFGVGHDPIHFEAADADLFDHDAFDDGFDHDPFDHHDTFETDHLNNPGAPIPSIEDGTFEDQDPGADSPLGENDEQAEPLHEGLEDLASSINDMNHEIDRLDHGHIDLDPS